MKLGLSTYAFPLSSAVSKGRPFQWLRELVALTAAVDCHCLQIGDNLGMDDLSAAQINELKAVAGDKGIELQMGARRLTEDSTLRALKMATALGSPFLRMVIDDANFEPGYADVRTLIRRLVPAFKDAGVQLAIENHDRFSARTLRRLVEETDPTWVAICLDTANSLGNGEGIFEVLGVLLPYVVNLHIKDIVIQRVPTLMGFTVRGVPAGQGIIDFPLILQHLEPTGRCSSAVLEVWHDPMDEASGRQQEMQAVEQSLNYLKKIFK